MSGPLVPLYVEVQSGDQIAPELEREFEGAEPERRIQEYVNFVGQRVWRFNPRADFQHKFTALKSTKIPNAFAIGNGNVYITRGLLNLLDDEAELAEVIGHEVAHVGYRHIGYAIEQSLGIGMILAVAEAIYSARKGDTLTERQQALVDGANSVIPSLVLNGYSRSHEYEADSGGFDFMVKAGYDPQGAVRVFRKFQKLSPDVKGLAVFFQSHPNASRRIDELQGEINKKYPGVTGETYRDRYQAIVKDGSSLQEVGGAGGGLPTLVYVAGGVVLAGGVVAAVKWLL
jgi:predicted Zn-dependent protease